jgi:hypothetical protein
MQRLDNTKVITRLLGTGVTAGATVTATFDTLGYEEAQIMLIMGTSNTVSNNPTTLKLEEGDTTSSYAAITGATGDTDFTIANADTSNPNVTVFNLDLRGRKRHLLLTVSPLTTQQTIATAILTKKSAGVQDVSATERGVLQVVQIA